MSKLIGFHVDCGRQGELEGRFIVDEEAHAKLQRMMREKVTVYFGEVLGKHSDVAIKFDGPDDESVMELTDSTRFLDMADELGIDLCSGYNPLDYFKDSEFDD